MKKAIAEREDITQYREDMNYIFEWCKKNSYLQTNVKSAMILSDFIQNLIIDQQN
mgnify:CR=1 FL=1